METITLTITKQEAEQLRKLADYVMDSEETHYEETVASEEDATDHAYTLAQTLDAVLTR